MRFGHAIVYLKLHIRPRRFVTRAGEASHCDEESYSVLDSQGIQSLDDSYVQITDRVDATVRSFD